MIFDVTLPAQSLKGQPKREKTTPNDQSAGNAQTGKNYPVCPVHKTNHNLNKCRGFRKMPLEDRKKILWENGLCFRCCSLNKHIAKQCKAKVFCEVCKNGSHPSGLHVDGNSTPPIQPKPDGGESRATKGLDDKIPHNVPVDSRCTQVCGKFGKSCAKTILVRVYHEKDQVNFRELYAILDEQSNHSLASIEFFYTSDEYGSTVEYTLRLCAGVHHCIRETS